ncbi:MAG: cytidine deaminase [Anaerostipes sp.]|nr:cytidine deaminase [Anaerostipes sp.]
MTKTELLESAKHAKENAYAPYSNFKVGAAVLTKTGEVFTGCNIENSSYGATICAERVAIGNAVSSGHVGLEMIAIASSGVKTVYPCGICRQVMNEFNQNMIILCESETGFEEYTLPELLPKGFD